MSEPAPCEDELVPCSEGIRHTAPYTKEEPTALALNKEAFQFIVYMAGPITGVVDYKDVFARYARALMKAGYGVLNPADDRSIHHYDKANWQLCMRLDISAMMDLADGVALLPGWFESEGAYLEASIARALKMPVQTIEGWLCAKKHDVL